MTFHHVTEFDYRKCTVCGNPILNYWDNAEETRGRTEPFVEVKGTIKHYYCIPGAKSLQEIDEERKNTN